MALSFQTLRLHIIEVNDDLPALDRERLIEQIPHILSSNVVENLPPYFHGINSTKQAENWFQRMRSESRLLQVKLGQHETIGFLFVYVENESDAHIGYLLAEEHWGKGYASELLQGFIHAVINAELWSTLIAGVEQSNHASIQLLKKLGFSQQVHDENSPLFFEYEIHRVC
ncbi:MULTISPECIES: GNAT family N-acetyltransferase [Pseudoalteromonas]|uniref:GNAT family N-acetyltransferase n=1 Tax=Pseudoalteromonas TaxID=53246 RepID=UPI00057F2FDB|nr:MULTISPECIES: GNAT family N-acetyltransferase [Pseudoalteromonas]KID33032.1 GCN5 family acetyltransferase [Pseudoalteromonas flavipulchra NCIMB 2033 = ATCC BAA-314]MBD0781198.1 GNAT family N-acetyltransferase [Pseudoalteromonas flavipulchra]RZG07778.1 N-acetyltransferase [Pseudoalteromonas sp. CO348]